MSRMPFTLLGIRETAVDAKRANIC
jgi:hypothetical protein